jgi:hypothetical protein
MQNKIQCWPSAVAVVGIVLGLMALVTTAPVQAAGPSGCHTVALEAHVTGEFPYFSGVLSGDLEGTADVVLDGDETSTGVVFHGSGEETWVISGGTIPALIGRTLTSVLTFTQPAAPGQGDISLINGTYRIVDGVQKGNLTFHATFDASVFPFVVDSEYRGVVCP